MKRNVITSAISGVIAAVIYIVIIALVGSPLTMSDVAVGVLIGLATFAIAYIINRVISARWGAK